MTAALGPLAPLLGSVYLFRAHVVALTVTAAIRAAATTAESIPLRPHTLLAAIWIFVGTAGLLLSTTSTGGFSELLSIAIGLMLIECAGPLARHPATASRLMAGWMTAWAASVAVAIWELMASEHLSNYLPSYVGTARVAVLELNLPASFFGNPNAFGTFLVLANVWISFLWTSRFRSARLASVAATAATPVLLVQSDARICLAAWVVAMCVASWPLLNRGRRLAAAVLAASTCALALILQPSFIAAPVGPDVSTMIHRNLSLNALWIAGESVGLGVGPGALESRMQDSAAPFETAGIFNAHNLWLEILAQYGLLVLGAILWWLISVWRSRSGPQTQRIQRAAIVAIALAAFADSSILESPFMWAHLFTIAAVAAYHADQRPSATDDASRASYADGPPSAAS